MLTTFINNIINNTKYEQIKKLLDVILDTHFYIFENKK